MGDYPGEREFFSRETVVERNLEVLLDISTEGWGKN